jgi:hypothetical protein
MSQKNKKFSFALWSLGVAVVGVIATILTVPEVRCSIGLLAETCPAPAKVVDLITQAETGEALAGVKLQVIGIGVPESQYTDTNGYAKINVSNRGDVRVILSKDKYPTQDFYINLANDQNTVRIVRLASSGKPQVSSSATVPPVPTTASSKEITWNDTAADLVGNVDQDFTFTCPPNGTIGNVWGADFYSSNSSICSAAVHAGLLSARDGGRAQIRIRSGERFYNGIARNGVSSIQTGRSNGSFVFLNSSGAPTATDQTQIIEWNKTAFDLSGKLDQDFTYNCTPNGTIGSVHGSDIYAINSSICSAAVHAGVIKTKEGGRIQIKIRPGEKFYNGTARNGVVSDRLGAYDWSFSFNKLN